MSDATLINIEAEGALLGALMSNNSAIDSVADMLSPEDFGEPAMGFIFSAIVRQRSLGAPANPVTLRPTFADNEFLAPLGGQAFLAGLTGHASALMDHKGLAEHIRDLSRRRALVQGLTEAISLAKDHDASTAEILDCADGALSEASGTTDGSIVRQASSYMADYLASLGQPTVRGVLCSVIPSLDGILGELRPGQLIIGAGRPGMGKTTVALSYSIGASQGGFGTLFVSREMTGVELNEKIASDLCFDGRYGVPFSHIMNKTLDASEVRSVSRAHEMLKDMPIYIVDASHMTIGRLNMLVRRYKRRLEAKKETLDLVVVDYLQLIDGDSRNASRYEVVSEVSRGLKRIAKEHGVAVLALAQLSREVEKRPDKRPMMSDLKESGQIEQDADAVVFLYRQEYYLRQTEPPEGDPERPEWEQALRDCQGVIDFIVAKRRNGPTGHAKGSFFSSYQAVR